jgi:hypothetical protein
MATSEKGIPKYRDAETQVSASVRVRRLIKRQSASHGETETE